jgi:hypothetical protein
MPGPGVHYWRAVVGAGIKLSPQIEQRLAEEDSRLVERDSLAPVFYSHTTVAVGGQSEPWQQGGFLMDMPSIGVA